MIGSCGSSDSTVISHRIMCSEYTSIKPVISSKEVNFRDVLNVLERDFKDVDETNGLSKEDRRFYDVSAPRRQVADGRYYRSSYAVQRKSTNSRMQHLSRGETA